MAFVKGDPRAGRPKGSENSKTTAVRDRIKIFLDHETKFVLAKVKQLPDNDRIRFYLEMLQYAIPKMKAIDITTDGMPIIDDRCELISYTTEELLLIQGINQKAIERDAGNNKGPD